MIYWLPISLSADRSLMTDIRYWNLFLSSLTSDMLEVVSNGISNLPALMLSVASLTLLPSSIISEMASLILEMASSFCLWMSRTC